MYKLSIMSWVGAADGFPQRDALLVRSPSGRLVKVDLTGLQLGETNIRTVISSLIEGEEDSSRASKLFFDHYIAPCSSCIADRGNPLPCVAFPAKPIKSVRGPLALRMERMMNRKALLEIVLPELERYSVKKEVPLPSPPTPPSSPPLPHLLFFSISLNLTNLFS